MSHLKFAGTLKSNNYTVKVNVPVISFENEGSIICYCPALDLSGYADTEEDAKKSFETSLGEYFRYTLNKNTLTTELKRLGWTVRKSKTKPMIPPEMSDLLRDNENFSDIFNKHPFRKYDTEIEMPAPVMA